MGTVYNVVSSLHCFTRADVLSCSISVFRPSPAFLLFLRLACKRILTGSRNSHNPTYSPVSDYSQDRLPSIAISILHTTKRLPSLDARETSRSGSNGEAHETCVTNTVKGIGPLNTNGLRKLTSALYQSQYPIHPYFKTYHFLLQHIHQCVCASPPN